MAEDTALVKQQTGITVSTQGSPIALKNLQDYLTLGEVLFKSGYFGDIKSASQAVAKMMAGAEMGFGPMASLSGVYIYGSKPSFMANLIASAVKRNGYDYTVDVLDEKECKITFYGRGGKLLGVSTFTMQDAIKAELTTGKNAHSWRHYPRNMLFSRTISNGARWYTPDIFGGVTPYTPDELDMVVDGETGQAVVQSTVVNTREDGQQPPQPEPVAPKPPETQPSSAPTVTEPVTPAPEQPAVKMVKIWDGKSFTDKSANDLVAQGSIDWFNRKFVDGVTPNTYNVWGKDKSDAQFHLFGNPNQRGPDGKRNNYGHIGKYYLDDKGNPKTNLRQFTYSEISDLIAYSWWKAGVREEGKGHLALPRYQDKVQEELDKLPAGIPTPEAIIVKANQLGVDDFETSVLAAFMATDMTKLFEHQREMAWHLLTQIESGVVDPKDKDKHIELLAG